MKKKWKLQDAKSKFSEVVEDALKKGPQYITRRGKDAVVIISVKEFDALTSNKKDFKEMLLNCPKIEDFDITNKKDYPRNIDI